MYVYIRIHTFYTCILSMESASFSMTLLFKSVMFITMSFKQRDNLYVIYINQQCGKIKVHHRTVNIDGVITNVLSLK